MNVILKLFKPISICCLVLILGGCAARSPVEMLKTLSKRDLPKPGQGVVTVRIIDASGRTPNFNHITITPKNYNESEEIQLPRLLAVDNHITKLSDTAIFASNVNAGSYSIRNLRRFFTYGYYTDSKWVSVNAKFGTFEVKAGQVTDLGTLIYYPRPQEDKYFDTVIRREPVKAGKVLDDYLPFYAYEQDNVLSWREDGLKEEQDTLYVFAAQNPIVYNNSYLAPDGSIYFVGNLGAITKRTAEGDWELDLLDTNLELKSIAQGPQGELLVGGSEGTLFYKTASGQWQDIAMPQYADISYVDFRRSGELVVIVRNEDGLQIYAGSAPVEGQKPDWKAKGRFDKSVGWSAQGRQDGSTTPHTHDLKNKLVHDIKAFDYQDKRYFTIGFNWNRIGDYLGNSQELVYEFDVESLTFKEVLPSLPIDYLRKAGNVLWAGENSTKHSIISTYTYKIKGQTHSNWIYVNAKLDPQEGGTEFGFLSTPWFSDEKNGIAVVRLKDKDKSRILVSTENSGYSWKKMATELPKSFCDDLVTLREDLIILSCNGSTSDFFESEDFGQSWEHVKEQQEF